MKAEERDELMAENDAEQGVDSHEQQDQLDGFSGKAPCLIRIPFAYGLARRDLPAYLGAGCTLVCLWLVGPDNMLLPALCVIVIALLGLRGRLDAQKVKTAEKEGKPC